MVVRMTTTADWIQEAVEKVKAAETEVILDFSSVLRIDGNGVRAIEELASLAEGRSAKVVLKAVNPDIYRVLKQLRLAQRFSFLT
jgi:anti-anti-sigma regulatory factor